MESPKTGIVIKGIPLYDNYDFSSSRSRRESHPYVIFVKMADATAEAATTEMERIINILMKVINEWDHEIVGLKEQM